MRKIPWTRRKPREFLKKYPTEEAYLKVHPPPPKRIIREDVKFDKNFFRGLCFGIIFAFVIVLLWILTKGGICVG